MQIKKIDIEHLNDLQNIFNEQFGVEAWSKAQILDSFNNSSTTFYGVFLDEKMVGFASVLISIDDINLLHIAIKQHYKNKGYAKELLGFLISLKQPNQSFSLEVKSKNIPAINLYKQFGFKTLNVRKKYYKDGDDALCMFL